MIITMVTMVTTFAPYKLCTNVKTYLLLKCFMHKISSELKTYHFYEEGFAFFSSVNKWMG